jgi:hypothetical protein
MSTARCGITNHEMLHALEGFRKSLVEKGHSERESLRCALALTFARSGAFTREQAWADADEIMAKLPQTTNTKGHDGNGH